MSHLPRVLQEAAARASDAVLRKLDRLPVITRHAEGRQRRSERREAIAALLRSLLARCDLRSLRVGVPDGEGGFRGVTMPQLAAESGLCLRRAERAAADLVACGVLTVYPIAQRAEGDDTGARWYGLAAIRRLSVELFGALELGGWLREERARLAKKARELSEAASARGRMALEQINRRLGRGELKGRAALRAMRESLRDANSGRPPRR